MTTSPLTDENSTDDVRPVMQTEQGVPFPGMTADERKRCGLDIDAPRLKAALRELSDAFVKGRQGSYGMRIPAEPYHDGDLVCGGAFRLIEQLERSLTASGDALKRYGWHGGGETMCERVKGSSYPCTCGLDAILAKGETNGPG